MKVKHLERQICIIIIYFISGEMSEHRNAKKKNRESRMQAANELMNSIEHNALF